MNDVTTSFLKVALHTLYYTRIDAMLAPLTQGAGVIFMLHHVRPEQSNAFAPNRILSITPEFLNLVVEHVLDRDFDIVSMDEAHERMVSGKSAARRFAAFTFDDGYRDNVEYALPIFRRHGVPMTLYVAPDFADGAGNIWWRTLEEILTVKTSICVPFASGDKTYDLTTASGKYAAHSEIYPWLRAMPDPAIHAHVNRWAAAAGIDPSVPCRDDIMRWDEVREINKDPLVAIGGHSMSHASLAKCSSNEAEWQIAASIEHIEHELGGDCRHFAYPYGDTGSAGRREFEIARNLGLRTAVTTQKGLIGSDVRDQLTALPRLSLNGDFQDERLVQVLLSGAPFKMLDLAKSAMPRRAA